MFWARSVTSLRSIRKPFLGAWQVPSKMALGPRKNRNIPVANTNTNTNVPIVNRPSRHLFFLSEPKLNLFGTVETREAH